MALSRAAIRAALEDGLLSFPVTDFDEQGKFRGDSFAARLDWFVEHQVSAIFVAGGTGEFFSLSSDEYRDIVKITADTVRERIPMISSVGRSIPDAIASAAVAEAAGMNALLLMPPYLTECPPEGIYAYAKTILNHTSLPVIYYNRGNGVLPAAWVQKLADECENLIGLKDGTGNMQELNDTIKTVGSRLSYIGGVPTAEIISEAYLSIGVNTYSSAVFNFVPRMAMQFYAALRAGNKERVSRIIHDFFIPFVRLRGRKSGYAVSLIKAGASLIGKTAGAVRPPLSMPTTEEISQLEALIRKASEWEG